MWIITLNAELIFVFVFRYYAHFHFHTMISLLLLLLLWSLILDAELNSIWAFVFSIQFINECLAIDGIELTTSKRNIFEFISLAVFAA